MQRESQLVTASRFAEDLSHFRHVEIGVSPSSQPQATLRFNMLSQPLFHKNIELLKETFADYLSKGFHIYVLADSRKQHERIRAILTEPLDPHEPPWTKFNRIFDKPKRKKIFARHLAPDWKEIPHE